MAYPKLPTHLRKEELTEYFTLQPEDLTAIQRMRNERNRLGFAVLLKTFQYLGYPPEEKGKIPDEIVEYLAGQLGLELALFQEFQWKGRAFKYHLSIVREYTGFHHCHLNERTKITEWLTDHGQQFSTKREFVEAAVQRFRDLGFELPPENKLRRIANSSRRRFLERLYQKVAAGLDRETRNAMDECIRFDDTETARFEWIKSRPGKTGMKTILGELEKLKYARDFSVERDLHFAGISDQGVAQFADRARAEDAYQMRRHPPAVRYTLLAALVHARGTEITDNVIKIFLQLVRRIEKKAYKSLEKEIVKEIRRVYGKRRILYNVALAVTENPDGIVRDVVFPVVGEPVFRRLVDELGEIESRYDLSKLQSMKKKYNHHYRRMMKPVLDAFTFRANNPAYQSVIQGLELVHRYLDGRNVYYPEHETIPDDLLKGNWKELTLEKGANGPRIVKQYFELCVLRKLERGLKCKEIWVEGAYRYRDPDRDLPMDWQQRRVEFCQKLGIPEEPEDFIEPIRDEMISGLEAANRYLRKKRAVYIYFPGGGERGLIRIPKIEKQPERPLLQEIKGCVIEKWGVLDLLDILIEADRQVDLLQSFQTSGQRQVISPQEARERLVLSLFSLGTNTELKRIHAAATPKCSYDDLLYFRKRFVRIPAVRAAITALTNRILEVRDPNVWGRATTCASDAKHLGAWNQNLMAEWNPHYYRSGVMAYWHVERNALCIYSQMTTCGASQVAPMLEGLVRHDTEMRVERNFVDSHGQSEIAFPFCRFLGIDLIPRLRRIKYERLYLPDQGARERLPNLAGILARPIRWDLIYEQYDEMMRHVVAVAEGTGPTESILWRFHSFNRSNPVYKAFAEAGKALKTIHMCQEITSPLRRRERHMGLNVIENFNAANEFICYGRKTELQTNDPELQELTILCLHLLQNTVILANTLMVERVLDEKGLLRRMRKPDLRALTPMFTSNVNPYGIFTVDFEKQSFLGAA